MASPLFPKFFTALMAFARDRPKQERDQLIAMVHILRDEVAAFAAARDHEKAHHLRELQTAMTALGDVTGYLIDEKRMNAAHRDEIKVLGTHLQNREKVIRQQRKVLIEQEQIIKGHEDAAAAHAMIDMLTQDKGKKRKK